MGDCCKDTAPATTVRLRQDNRKFQTLEKFPFKHVEDSLGMDGNKSSHMAMDFGAAKENVCAASKSGA